MGGATAGRGAACRRQLRPVGPQGPIDPDERLEADPLAESTVEEAAAAQRGALEEADDAVGLVLASHPFEVLADADITPEEEQAAEEDDDEPPPAPSLGIHIEPRSQAR